MQHNANSSCVDYARILDSAQTSASILSRISSHGRMKERTDSASNFLHFSFSLLQKCLMLLVIFPFLINMNLIVFKNASKLFTLQMLLPLLPPPLHDAFEAWAKSNKRLWWKLLPLIIFYLMHFHIKLKKDMKIVFFLHAYKSSNFRLRVWRGLVIFN